MRSIEYFPDLSLITNLSYKNNIIYIPLLINSHDDNAQPLLSHAANYFNIGAHHLVDAYMNAYMYVYLYVYLYVCMKPFDY